MTIVLDTSAYAAFANGDARVTSVMAAATQLYLPATALGELLFGYRNGSKLDWNLARINKFLSSSRVNLVPINREVAEQYALIRYEQKTKGLAVAENDLWIAACASYLGQPLLTLDSDFSRIPDLQLVSLD